MNNYFETEARVDASRTDTLFRLSLLGMLELIEDAETMHTEEMKVDAPTLYREDGAFWVITRNFLHIERVPVWEENLIVGTYPLPPSLMRCERQNYIKDQKGNLLVASKTEWCVLDAKTRKLRPVSGLTCYPKDLEHKKERVLISSLSEKKPEFLPADLKFTHIVRCSDLDFNHHVNNAKYVNFIYDCYPSEFWEKIDVSDMRLDYINECREGETLEVYSTQKETSDENTGKTRKTVFFLGKTSEKRVFSAIIKTR